MNRLAELIADADPLRDQSPRIPAALAAARVAAIAAEPVPATRRRHNRRPLRIATAGALAAAALTAGGLALRAEDRPGPVPAVLPGVVLAAAEQIRSGEGILHIVEGPSRTLDGGYDRGGNEAWIALDLSGWRLRSGRPCDDLAMAADGTQHQASCRSRTVRTIPPEQPFDRDDWLGLLPANAFIDATLLGGEDLKPEGEVVLDGVPAYQASVRGIEPSRTIHFFAKDDGRLLKTTFAAANPSDPTPEPIKGEMTYRVWEVLPDTPENRALTRLPN